MNRPKKTINSIDGLIKRSMDQCGKKFYDAFANSILLMVHQGYKSNILHNPRLVMYKLMSKTIDGITIKKGMERKISGVINVMKYQGDILNDWTIDTTRAINIYTSFEDKADGLDALASSFYLDRWKRQPKRVLLMCEASGYLGVIKNIADKFRCPYVPAKGDMSVQLKMEIADLINDNTIIIYFGDYDKKGLQIPKTIENDIRILNSNNNFIFHRLFLNEEDIKLYDLKRDDNDNVQMEQLPENIAINEASKFIENIIDVTQWMDSANQEKAIRNELRSIA